MLTTDQQYDAVIKECRDIFSKKLMDYGCSWRILRPSSVTDQIFIKAARIRTIETKKEAKIEETVRNEWIAIVNYGIIGLIQLDKGYSEELDMTADEALACYDRYVLQAKTLMMAKNHDYDEAWRLMRIESYTDLILMKLHRTKQIENNSGHTLISEGIDANYYDMINYAVFALIKLTFENEPQSFS